MAMNQSKYNQIHHLDAGLVLLAGHWAIGATGAVGAKTAGTGLTLTRTATGDYTITVDATGGVPSIAAAFVDLEEDADQSYDVAMKVSTASAGTVTFTVYVGDASTTPADPPSGSFIHALVVVKNSSVAR